MGKSATRNESNKTNFFLNIRIELHAYRYKTLSFLNIRIELHAYQPRSPYDVQMDELTSISLPRWILRRTGSLLLPMWVCLYTWTLTYTRSHVMVYFAVLYHYSSWGWKRSQWKNHVHCFSTTQLSLLPNFTNCFPTKVCHFINSVCSYTTPLTWKSREWTCSLLEPVSQSWETLWTVGWWWHRDDVVPPRPGTRSRPSTLVPGACQWGTGTPCSKWGTYRDDSRISRVHVMDQNWAHRIVH